MKSFSAFQKLCIGGAERSKLFMVKALPDESVLRNFDSMDGALAAHLPLVISTAWFGLLARLTEQVRKPSKCSCDDVFRGASVSTLHIPFNILSIR